MEAFGVMYCLYPHSCDLAACPPFLSPWHLLHVCLVAAYVQLTIEQHGFELHRSTYTWIVFNE